jgi:hypothetical protein
MTTFAPVEGFIGGLLIGLAAVALMASIGRIAGVSGIALNAMLPADGSGGRGWRIAFLAGLPLGAALVTALGLKDWSGVILPSSLELLAVAGALVGAGTTLAGGCTSGHGICGLARLSPGSLAATLVFMATAVVTVFVIRHVI